MNSIRRSKGLDSHPVFRLGKAPAKKDPRNLRLAAILRLPVKVPSEYDFDLKHPRVPTPMFANDRLGCCVIAGRAHQTLRFELSERDRLLGITDRDVTSEYFRESGGKDTGLVVGDSLNEWRKQGWRAAGKRYYIQAYAELSPRNHLQVKQAIFADIGIGIGLALPRSANAQIQAGRVWDVVSGPAARPNSWGGHYVHLPGYTRAGPVCVTWGRKQQMTWAFFDKYCDEAFAIIDAVDRAKVKRLLDARKLRVFLGTVTRVRRRK